MGCRPAGAQEQTKKRILAVVVTTATLVTSLPLAAFAHKCERQPVRHRFSECETAAEFAGKLQQTLTIEELADIWAGTVETSLQPRTVRIWLRTEKG